VEFLIEGRLAAVAVVDQLFNALSAVYTYFDADFADYSPGVFAVLWQVEEARRRNLEFVYLGFWIADCRKMNYKIQYQPLEGLIADEWQLIHQQKI
jgi:arginine-tRNA-protein transferase